MVVVKQEKLAELKYYGFDYKVSGNGRHYYQYEGICIWERDGEFQICDELSNFAVTIIFDMFECGFFEKVFR